MEDTATLEQAAAATQGGGMSIGEFISFVWQTWVEGGWLMVPLAGLALLIYFEAMSLILRLGKAKVKKTPRSIWSEWLDDPSKGSGHIGEVIRFVVGDGIGSSNALLRVEAVKSKLLPDVNSRIVVLSILVTIAPLMGLLGTVIGMLTTFRGLATASGQAVDLVAEGIRVALITTQTGLMIAIPGYIFISMVIRSRNTYLAFLAELETTVVQRIHKLEDAK
ncbi:MotA/TolQ/ExbB proton channel family protein [Puniceicoccales bacterium CK1056]|uniref:MotA/TolQ/ExbB proton channel family protein n=1 Tax=Oceanipulchritudo coccoides TaxID=2706888 RepID=A0A6B2LY73_9BACT|nr:MotA/TolQ/ExbB proton channel family protein [Oceanipulchritudo coccoides]NDV61293.1 MotA/TolQ/ExbB proton channel family protein [Oceanipulchritudo coccoides]